MSDHKTRHGYPVADSQPRLHKAALNNDESLLRNTLQQKPDVNVYWDGEMALHVACRLGYHYIVSTLIDHGADVTTQLMYRQVLPLGVAIENQQTHIGMLLIGKGKFFDHQKGRDYGVEALSHCAAAGDNEIHSCILQQGCLDINHVLSSGWTALRMAVNYRQQKMVVALLNAGADSNVLTPLEVAIRRQDTKIVKILIQHHADVNSYDNKRGGHCIHLAVESERVESVKYLLENGTCDLSLLNRDGKTPLYLAAELGYPKIVHELLFSGADPNIGMPSFSGATPLIAALDMPVTALYINPNKPVSAIVLLLIKYGADPNLGATEQIAPFAFAVENGHFRAAMLLIAADCQLKLSKCSKHKDVDVGSRCTQEEDEADFKFIQCYAEAIQDVLSLSRHCRRAIRRSMVCPITKSIAKLPIPTSMKDFLLIPSLYHLNDPVDFKILE